MADQSPPDAKPPDDTTSYAKYFTDSAFWQKVKDHAGKIGRASLTKAIELYHVAVAPDTPVWAKAVALGSLGYFILPLDVVPDLIPVAGLTDDAAAIAAAATVLLKNITPAIRAKAAEQVTKWFGADAKAPPAGEPPVG
ncbi:MAG: DUF1232 domain-containing protein [Fimbriiglobus sp.]|nr:DUF1232 domain-containing protein [Fimbriiglobus sp.]